MSVIKIFCLLIVVGAAGCSSNPNYDKAARCGSVTPLCLAAAAVEDLMTRDKSSSKNCSEMTGQKHKACEAQVKSLNKHIRDASQN